MRFSRDTHYRSSRHIDGLLADKARASFLEALNLQSLPNATAEEINLFLTYFQRKAKTPQHVTFTDVERHLIWLMQEKYRDRVEPLGS